MKKSIKKNYVYNLLFQMLTVLLPLITTPYLSRVLGVSGIGINSYTLSIVSYFIIFGCVGVASYGQREIALCRDDSEKRSRVFWELFLYKSITCIISLLLYIIVIFLIDDYRIIYMILSLNLFASIFDISWFFQGLEEYKMIAIRNIFIKIIFMVSIFLFVKTSNDLVLYIFINSLSLIISNLLLWIKVFNFIDKVKLKEMRIFSHCKNTIIYFLPQIATQIYTMLDKTMIMWITQSEAQNGYYEQAYKIITISLTIIISFNTVMSPRMSYLYGNNKTDEIKNRLFRSILFVFFLGIPMCLGLACISNDLITWFLGIEFSYVKILLPMFAPLILIIGLSNCIGGQCLTPCGKRAKSAMALWCGAAVNFVLNLFLIRYYQSFGAMISSVIAETIITIIYFYLAREYLDFKLIAKRITKFLISGIAMMISLLMISFPATMWWTLLKICIGGIIYFSFLIILKESLFLEVIEMIKIKFKRS